MVPRTARRRPRSLPHLRQYVKRPVIARPRISLNQPESIPRLSPLPNLQTLGEAAPAFGKITDACVADPTLERVIMLEACALSDKGCVRANNEDYLLIEPGVGLYVLADGMGGA